MLIAITAGDSIRLDSDKISRILSSMGNCIHSFGSRVEATIFGVQTPDTYQI